jgi:hypothetical protein
METYGRLFETVAGDEVAGLDALALEVAVRNLEAAEG